MLTTECIIAEIPEEQTGHALIWAAWGGMGGMGGMM